MGLVDRDIYLMYISRYFKAWDLCHGEDFAKEFLLIPAFRPVIAKSSHTDAENFSEILRRIDREMRKTKQRQKWIASPQLI